jgi:adenylate cyclase
VTKLSARLCGEARGGEILLAPRVLAALDEGAFAVEPAGEFVLKGFARPIVAARVRGGE